MELLDLDFSYYNVELIKFLNEINLSDIAFNGQNIELRFRPVLNKSSKIEDLLNDMHLMSSLRQQCEDDPAVQEAFQQLLTVIALKKG